MLRDTIAKVMDLELALPLEDLIYYLEEEDLALKKLKAQEILRVETNPELERLRNRKKAG